MMDNSKIIELLKKHDLPLPMPYGSQYFEEYKARYQAFAQDAIENYKASLVLVGYERKGILFFKEDISDESLYTKLYVLEETK